MDLSRKFYTGALALVLLVTMLTLYVTKEFLTTILLSVFLAYMLNPVYKYTLGLTGKKSLSSFISIILVFIVFVFIVISTVGVLSNEVSGLLTSEDAYQLVSNFSFSVNNFVENNLPEPVASYVKQMGGLSMVAEKYLPTTLAYYFVHIGEIPLALLYWMLPILQNSISGFLTDLPIRFAQFLVAIFFTYYFLIDGGDIVYKIISELPEKGIIYHFIKELNTIYNNLFNVYFITCMLSGIFATIGFSLISTPYPVLLGAIVAIFTLIPMVGPVVIFLPMSIYYLLIHDYFRGVFVLVFGIVVLTIIPENVLRPRLAMKGASIHPIITILAYTAPIFVVGIMGVVVGPALYGFLLAVYRTAVYLRLKKKEEANISAAAEPPLSESYISRNQSKS
jgi:predicted PurR-regulated permease PerM